MGGLHFANPSGLWLLTGLAPLVLLYILKIRRQRQRVGSTWLWAAAQRDLVAKHPFKRLVPEIPLLLEVLALVALAIALARPTFGPATMEGDHVAIVIDASASMGTRIGGPNGTTTRMDAAKAAAAAVVSRLGSGADAMIIAATREARIVCPPDRDPARLEAALRGLSVAEVEGDLLPSVALAADRLRSLGGHGRLVLVTDGALANQEPIAVGGLATEILDVGDDEDNTAIVRVDVRSGVDSGTGREQVQVFAMVKTWGSRPRDSYLTLSIEGHPEPVASRRLLVAPGDAQPVVLSFEPRAEDHGAGLTLNLAPGDALPLDDVAFARVPGSLRMPVAVVSTAPDTWTSRALEADGQVDLRRLSPADLGTVNLDPDTLIVLEGICPTTVPGGDVLVVAPPAGSCFGVRVGPTVQDPPITSWETSDPRLRFLTLDGVHVSRAPTLTVDGTRAGLVRSSAGTLVADASKPGRSVTLVAFDVGDSDWPLKASFVLFVRNVVELARSHRLQGGVGSGRTGDALRASVPVGTRNVKVDGPGTTDRDVAARDGLVTLPSVDQAGLYHVRWVEPHVGEVVLPANLTSVAESDVIRRPVPLGTGPEIAAARPAADVERHGNGLRWLAALAALVLVADLWWVTRQPRARGAPAR